MYIAGDDENIVEMRCQQVHLLLFVAAISVAAVGFVLGTAVLSIFIVFALKSLFAVIINAVAFIAELIIAVVAAITSGIHVRLKLCSHRRHERDVTACTTHMASMHPPKANKNFPISVFFPNFVLPLSRQTVSILEQSKSKSVG